MDDINDYALNIDLNIQSNVEDVLSGMTSIMSDIDDQVKGIASNIIGDLTSSFGSASDAVSDIISSFSTFDSSVVGTGQSVTDMLNSMLGLSDAQNNINDQAGAGLGLFDAFAPAFDNANLSMGSVLDSVGDIALSLVDLTSSAGAFSAIITGGAIIVALKAMSKIIDLLNRSWDMMLDEEERFITLNYRLYGSQRDLLGQVNDTTREYDLLRGTALEAYEVLAGQLRIPQEELGEYVELLSKFNRTTDVSIQNSADLVRQLTLVGFSYNDVEREIRGYEQAMRAAGATSEEIQSLIQHQLDQTINRTLVFGEESLRVVNEQERAMAALLRSVGMNADAYLNLNRMVENDAISIGILTTEAHKYAEAINAAVGYEKIQIDSLTELEQVHLGVVAAVHRLSDVYYNEGSDAMNKMIQSNAELGALFGSAPTEDIQQMVVAFKALEDAGADTTSILHMLDSASPDWRNQADIIDAYEKSLGAIAARFETLQSTMISAGQDLMITLAPAFLWLLDNVFQPIVDVLSTIIDIIDGVVKAVAILLSPLLVVIDLFMSLVQGIVNAIQDAVQPFIDIIDVMYKSLFSNYDIINDVKVAFEYLGYAVGWIISAVFLPLTTTISAVLNVLGWLNDKLDITGKTVEILYVPIEMLSNLFGAIYNQLASVYEWFGFLSDAMDIMNPIVDSLLQLFNVFYTEMMGAIDEALKPLYDAFKDLFSMFYDDESVQGATDNSLMFAIALEGLKKFVDIAAFGIQGLASVVGVFGNVVGTVIGVTLQPMIATIQFIIGVVESVIEVIQMLFSMITSESSVATSSMGWFLDSVMSAVPGLGFLASALEHAVNWFGANGAGLIEESEMAANKLNDLVDPLRDSEEHIVKLADSLSIISSSFNDLSGGVITSVVNELSNLSNISESVDIDKTRQDLLVLSDSIDQLASSLMSINSNVNPLQQMVANSDVDVNGLFDSIADVKQAIITALSIYNDIADDSQSDVMTLHDKLINDADILSAGYEVVANSVVRGLNRIESAGARSINMLSPLSTSLSEYGISINDVLSDVTSDKRPISAETMSNIMIESDQSADESRAEKDKQDNTAAIVAILQQISGKMDGVGSVDVSEIVSLLNQYMPQMADSGPKIGQSLNDWGG